MCGAPNRRRLPAQGDLAAASVIRSVPGVYHTQGKTLIRPERQDILSDAVITLSSDSVQERCPVVVRDTSGEEIVLLTHHLKAVLRVAIYRVRPTFGGHLSRLVALLRMNLLTYRDLTD